MWYLHRLCCSCRHCDSCRLGPDHSRQGRRKTTTVLVQTSIGDGQTSMEVKLPEASRDSYHVQRHRASVCHRGLYKSISTTYISINVSLKQVT
jgi:hypothetical protein